MVAQSSALVAAAKTISTLAGLMEHRGIDPRVLPRLAALVPCLQAQLHAADVGKTSHSSSGLVHPDLHVLGGAAKHEFGKDVVEDFSTLTPELARRRRRGRRSTRAVASNSDGSSCPASGASASAGISGRAECSSTEASDSAASASAGMKASGDHNLQPAASSPTLAAAGADGQVTGASVVSFFLGEREVACQTELDARDVVSAPDGNKELLSVPPPWRQLEMT